jgi:hypothetical protein
MLWLFPIRREKPKHKGHYVHKGGKGIDLKGIFP